MKHMANNRRGILTDREREILLNEGEDVTEKYYGVVVSRVRSKIERIDEDLPALDSHPSLGNELRDVVCSE